VGDLKEFRSFLARQEEAEAALVQGDVEPRLALWSRRDPVSLLGAARGNTTGGWDALHSIFVWVAQILGGTKNTDFRFDVEVAEVSADGQMAYSVGFERFNRAPPDGVVQPTTVRVTHVYRREGGDWKIVHRHGSVPPVEETSPTEAP
jgi:ketosteroid isomerase-like protein